MGDVLVIIGIIFVVLASIAWLFSLIIAIYTGEYQRILEQEESRKIYKKPGVLKRIYLWFVETDHRRWGM
ncbi:hypothetical protein C7Y71_004080 [Pseudoprevotella muciniphila]|uniref:Uncharacterized protein n=1 Tax=Pseudoprevotella muciniphila TaxID=2133944 RepID=A0A5P8E5Q0_9BACT|nr:hypothetical protein C7Y71_004080 [Pseudoprevotella muciniphila]